MKYTPAALKSLITTVIFDFGGVLGLPQDPARAAGMATRCRMSPEEFFPLYVRDRLELDRGTLSTEEYWARIFRAAGVPESPEAISAIEEEDSLSWTGVNPSVVAWASELRTAGYATAILSNMPPDKLSWMRKNPTFDFIKDFAVAVFSCNYRLVKPEREIYRLCLDLLGREPGECLFLDDSMVNIDAARAAGMPALHFRSAKGAAAELAAAWKLPVTSLVRNSHG